MKKFLMLLLAMLVALSFACAEDAVTMYDFEDGAPGPFQQSGSCTLSVSEAQAHSGTKALAVTARSGNNWDCTDLVPANAGFALGDTVTISAWVYVDSDVEGTFCIAKSAADYGWYGNATIPGKVWTEVTASFTLEDEVNVRFQNYGDQWNSVDFYMDDVTVTVAQPEPASVTTVCDFEDGTPGLFVSSGSCTLSTSTDIARTGTALAVTARSGNNWDCADLTLAEAGIAIGDHVTISAWVYVDNDAEGTFCIAEGGADYSWFGNATIPGKTWTEVTATFSPDTESNIRFQNYGDQWNSADFYLDDVTITVTPAAPVEEVPMQTVATVFDFESGLPEVFSLSGSATPTTSGAQVHSGASALYVTGRSGNNWDCVDLLPEASGIALNAPVKLSFWIYVDSDEEGTFRVAKGGSDYAGLGQAMTFPGKTWTEMTVEFTMEEIVNIRFQNSSDNWNSAEFYIDDMTLEVGVPMAEEEVVNDAPPMDYRSDFSEGLDGWYPRSGNEAAALTVTEEGGILMTGRTGTWNSPGRDFELVPGRTYNVSVLVKQETGEPLNFILSCAKTRNEEESYENWCSGSVPSGEWTMISGSHVCSKGDKFVLYVEGGTENAEFQIKDFIIAEPVSGFGKLDVSLKDVYAEHFDMGTAVTAGEYLNADRMEFYGSQFNIFTAGNEMKPESLLDMGETRKLQRKTKDQATVVLNFDNVIPLLDWAKENGAKIHGHTLVWYQQTPKAFFHEDYATHKPLLDRETMLLRMEAYISQVLTWVGENYPGLIVSWDVVNEAIDDGNGGIRDCLWSQVVGEDYVNIAFQMARKYAEPGTLLFYNDYNTDDTQKQIGIIKLVDSLIADGTIDGYGFQSHYSIEWPMLKKVEIAWTNLAAKNLADGSPLLLRVSELDVGIPDTTEENLQKQADYYDALFQLYVKHADRIIAVHTWGTVDDLSWRADKYPLLFDAKVQPKPAFDAIVD